MAIPSGSEWIKSPSPIFVDRALHVLTRDAGRAQSDIRFDGASEKEWILQHDPEMAPQVLQIEQPNVHAIQQDLAALNVVETQQQGNERGLARPGVADDSERLPRRKIWKDTSRSTQSSSAGSATLR